MSQPGDTALYFGLGGAASAHGSPAATLVLTAVNLPQSVLCFIIDALGLILVVTVTAASLSDNATGIQLLGQAKNTYPTISRA